MSMIHNVHLKNLANRAMENYGFLPEFSPKVLQEVKELRSFKKNDGVRDLRSLLWSSLDNHDSKDLDQLEYAELHARKEIRVLVAIADVDEYVKKGLPTDHHASRNGTSVYTGIQIFTLFPTRLSWDLSSLNEGEDRLAIVAEYFVLQDGNVRFGEIFPALVHNKAKLIYEEVGEWLEGKAKIPESVVKVDGLSEQLLLQDEAAQRLYQLRMENGALELETIEPVPVFQEGNLVDLFVRRKNRARDLIENFMIAANRTMADFLKKNHVPAIQRIVRTPDRWDRIVEVAEGLGGSLPPVPDSKALSDFLSHERRRDPLKFPDLSLTIIKLIGPGEYVMTNSKDHGHFGLAVSDYTHSTAPNRRYVDLIIQRLIKSVLSTKTVPYNTDELIDIASWCTVRDKAAKKVERFIRKVAGAILLSDRAGEWFDAIVTGASEKGTYVRIFALPIEGRLVRGERGLDVGQKARVRLVRVDVDHGYIDFERSTPSPRI